MITRSKIDNFILIYQKFRLRERRGPRRAFRIGGRPWLFMVRGAENCDRLGIPPERYIGILVSHHKSHALRAIPSPRQLASQDALQIIRRFLERVEAAEARQTRVSDLAIDVGASTFPTEPAP